MNPIIFAASLTWLASLAVAIVFSFLNEHAVWTRCEALTFHLGFAFRLWSIMFLPALAGSLMSWLTAPGSW